MVHDLIFESHPGKLLEEHIRGVLEGTLRRSSLSLAENAALFHDLGKMNPNFQKKLYGKSGDYSNHSYLSVIAFVNYAARNFKDLMSKYGFKTQNECMLFVFQVAVIIGKHHNHLPNLCEAAFYNDISACKELYTALEFIRDEAVKLPMSTFLKEKLEITHTYFDLDWNSKFNILASFSKSHKAVWANNPLKNFFDTQSAFAALIEADKRDAGDNHRYFFDDKIVENTNQLSKNLKLQFDMFENSGTISELNLMRTKIRLEALDSIKSELNRGKRVFTLTAPTGAGKTYTMLAVADEIKRQKGDLGIIYSLPFLSITEQVKIISEELVDDVLSVNSKSENERINIVQNQYEKEQNQENLAEILKENFTEQTFDHPFIITTFVQFFETLVSNKNSTLLKIPNFANRIFLIDEVQALPPRLYIFFAAWITEFCKRNNSYAILSTATMPNFNIPIKKHIIDKNERADLLFRDYCVPNDLIEPKKYFDQNIFNRYSINFIENEMKISNLADHILAQSESCLVILNTIADTKELYSELTKQSDIEIKLLNTYFIPDDRTQIIKNAKDKLKSGVKTILISTQLIEAGVDIDFPVVYRDMCPLPSLIQSAGRCNRNKNIEMGQVYFFELKSESGKSRSSLIYRDEGKRFLDFCKETIPSLITENELFDVQSKFFNYIQSNLTIGEHRIGKDKKINMVACVNKGEFENLGRFKLIDNKIGEQCQFYVLEHDDDFIYDKLETIIKKLKLCDNYQTTKAVKIELNSFLKKLSGRMLNIHVNRFNKDRIPKVYDVEILGIKFIPTTSYSEQTGLILDNYEECYI